MYRDAIDWTSRKVRYWYLDFVDLSRSFKSHDQLEFDEDLALISYPRGISLDIGWYPGLKKRKFRVWLVRHDTPESWWKPIFNSGCRTTKEVIPLIKRGVAFIQERLITVSDE
jgi:hypothetical protein